MRYSVIAVVLLSCVLASACDPFKEQREAAAEKKRIECLDRFCEGDDPGVPPPGHRYLKLNGTKYLAPAAYVKGFAGLSFYWPSKTPVSGREDRGPYPEKGQEYSAVAVDIFLTGRARWPDPKAERPWERQAGMSWLDERRKEGLPVEEEQLHRGLIVYRIRNPDRSPYWDIYLATEQKSLLGDKPPAIFCDMSVPRIEVQRCTGGEFWQPDVYADFRFNAAHAKDWPELHAEIARVLNLLTKVPE